jgi:hypothetical protein
MSTQNLAHFEGRPQVRRELLGTKLLFMGFIKHWSVEFFIIVELERVAGFQT